MKKSLKNISEYLNKFPKIKSIFLLLLPSASAFFIYYVIVALVISFNIPLFSLPVSDEPFGFLQLLIITALTAYYGYKFAIVKYLEQKQYDKAFHILVEGGLLPFFNDLIQLKIEIEQLKQIYRQGVVPQNYEYHIESFVFNSRIEKITLLFNFEDHPLLLDNFRQALMVITNYTASIAVRIAEIPGKRLPESEEIVDPFEDIQSTLVFFELLINFFESLLEILMIEGNLIHSLDDIKNNRKVIDKINTISLVVQRQVAAIKNDYKKIFPEDELD